MYFHRLDLLLKALKLKVSVVFLHINSELYFVGLQTGLKSCHSPLLPDAVNDPNTSGSDPMQELALTELNEEK